jgi:hypothetical protein
VVRIPGGWEFFSLTPCPDRLWGPLSLLSNGHKGILSLGIKRPGRKADHSPPSSAEVKECVDLYFHFPNTSSWRGAQLKHRDNFSFYLLISSRQTAPRSTEPRVSLNSVLESSCALKQDGTLSGRRTNAYFFVIVRSFVSVFKA